MKCINCKQDCVETIGLHVIKVDLHKFEGLVSGVKCKSCEIFYENGPASIELELTAGVWLAEHGFQTGEEIIFMRKVAGLSAVNLANLLGVSTKIISEWEMEKRAACKSALIILGELVLSVHRKNTIINDKLKCYEKPSKIEYIHL